jgi:hypothetical protein
MPARNRGERRVILSALRDLLGAIGSANDAEDHGYIEDADRMRKDSCEAIQGLITKHVFLAELLPKLQWELETQHILGFGWAELCDGVDAYLKVSVNEHRDG